MPTEPREGSSPRWRSLDALAWSLVLTAVAVYVPRIGRTFVGDLNLLYMVPLLVGAAAVWRLRATAQTEWLVWRFRASWLTLSGLAPFASWWQRCPESLFLAVGAMLALGALGWCLLEAVAVTTWLGTGRGIPWLRRETLLARVVLLYMLLIPIVALCITFMLSFLMGTSALPSDWLRSWRLIPTWGRTLLCYCPLVAVLNLARLLFRLAGALASSPTVVRGETVTGSG